MTCINKYILYTLTFIRSDTHTERIRIYILYYWCMYIYTFILGSFTFGNDWPWQLMRAARRGTQHMDVMVRLACAMAMANFIIKRSVCIFVVHVTCKCFCILWFACILYVLFGFGDAIWSRDDRICMMFNGPIRIKLLIALRLSFILSLHLPYMQFSATILSHIFQRLFVWMVFLFKF